MPVMINFCQKIISHLGSYSLVWGRILCYFYYLTEQISYDPVQAAWVASRTFGAQAT